MISLPKNNWNKTKELVKQMVKEDQIKEWKDDVHGRILKKYQYQWNNNITFTKQYDKQMGIIRKLRLGCSDLADHKGFLFMNPGKCPACDCYNIETNEHYMERCEKYRNERYNLYKNLNPLLKKK